MPLKKSRYKNLEVNKNAEEIGAMYLVIQRSNDALPEDQKLPADVVVFPDYDVLHEYVYHIHMIYYDMFYTGLKSNPRADHPMLETYKKQVKTWQSLGNKTDLTRDEILEIIGK